jgi:ATP-binding protein involved in chromosome partitioning
MSYYICKHCGQPEHIFGEGGAERLGQKLKAPVLARIPLDPAVRSGSDGGSPVVLAAPDSPSGKALRQAAESVLSRIAALPEHQVEKPGYIHDHDPELRFVNS